MLVLKGIIIGLGKIIPGVSGSMLAISLGVYQKLIDSINNFFKYPKKYFSFLLKITVGVVVSIVFFSNIIINALNNNYLITMFLFVGLIIGGFEDIRKSITSINKRMVFLSIFIMLILGIVTINNEISIQNYFLRFIYFLFAGFIDAFTTIVPGISGTATLMMIGAYDTLITSFSTIFDLYYFTENLEILLPFFIGFLIGILVTAKIIQILFEKHKSNTYSSILGFSISTIILMLLRCLNSHYDFFSLIIGFFMMGLGYFITKKINKIFNC